MNGTQIPEALGSQFYTQITIGIGSDLRRSVVMMLFFLCGRWFMVGLVFLIMAMPVFFAVSMLMIRSGCVFVIMPGLSFVAMCVLSCRRFVIIAVLVSGLILVLMAVCVLCRIRTDIDYMVC